MIVTRHQLALSKLTAKTIYHSSTTHPLLETHNSLNRQYELEFFQLSIQY